MLNELSVEEKSYSDDIDYPENAEPCGSFSESGNKFESIQIL